MKQMKRIKLNEETTKKFQEALEEFMVNPKKGNEMLDKIHEEQQQKEGVNNHQKGIEP